MKTAIIYESTHHENTKKLVDAIKNAHPEVDVYTIDQAWDQDFSGYVRIGCASGIAFSRFYKKMEKFAEEKMPKNKDIFFLFTCGSKKDTYTNSMEEKARKAGCRNLGSYGALGFDTYGPFKLVGGIAKGHPDAGEIAGAVDFYESL